MLESCFFLYLVLLFYGAGRAFLCLIPAPFRKSASDQSLFDRIALPTAVSLLILQLAFFCYRPFASLNAFGIHYSAPYPVVRDLKKTINFADWSFLRNVQSSDKIGIQTEDRFMQGFARMLLRSHRIKFCLEAPAFDAKGDPRSGGRTSPCQGETALLNTAKATEGAYLLKLNFQRIGDVDENDNGVVRKAEGAAK
jgi:hypothetical protein